MLSITLLARVAVLAVTSTLVVGIQAQITLADGGSNSPPVAQDDALNTAEGTAGSTNVLANDTDPDDDPLSIDKWTDGTYGSVSCSGTDCVYIPNDPDYSGPDAFTYMVSDGRGGTDVGDVAVEVVPTNEEPSAAEDALTLTEDTSDSVDVFANDTDDDGDPLALETLEPTADNGTVSCTVGGLCTYTPEPNFEGFDTFQYTVTDGQGGTDSANVEITVTPVNDVPNAVDDSLVTSEGQMGSLNVRTNDVDIDGDTLLLTTLTPAASHGTVACLGGGGCSYTPVTDYSGPDSFQYTIADGHGGTDTATVNITVLPENNAPVADDDAISTVEDNAGSTNVLAGDADVDGDTLSVSSASPAATHGTVSCAAGGVCTYTPSANYNGPDSFDYTVSDGRGKSDTGTVTVTVLPGNDAPVAVDDSLSTAEETAGQVDVLPNDTDLESDSLSVTGSTNGAHGTASCDATTCTYTPALDYTGADTFTYTVSDGKGGTDTGSVSVTVTGVNDAPVADDDALTTDEETPGNVSVLVGDTDVDGDTLTVASPSDPTTGPSRATRRRASARTPPTPTISGPTASRTRSRTASRRTRASCRSRSARRTSRLRARTSCRRRRSSGRCARSSWSSSSPAPPTGTATRSPTRSPPSPRTRRQSSRRAAPTKGPMRRGSPASRPSSSSGRSAWPRATVASTRSRTGSRTAAAEAAPASRRSASRSARGATPWPTAASTTRSVRDRQERVSLLQPRE